MIMVIAQLGSDSIFIYSLDLTRQEMEAEYKVWTDYPASPSDHFLAISARKLRLHVVIEINLKVKGAYGRTDNDKGASERPSG